MFGDVREKLQVQKSREFRGELVAQPHQPGTNMSIELLHPLVEALDLEDLETGRRKSQSRHGLPRLPIARNQFNLLCARALVGDTFAMGRLPVPPVEIAALELRDIDPVEAADVDVD